MSEFGPLPQIYSTFFLFFLFVLFGVVWCCVVVVVGWEDSDYEGDLRGSHRRLEAADAGGSQHTRVR